MKNKFLLICLVFLLSIRNIAQAQISIDTTVSAQELADTLIGSGVSISNAIYTGFAQSEKYFKYFNINPSEIFKINKKNAGDFKKKYSYLFENNKVIAIHVRRGDYDEFGSG